MWCTLEVQDVTRKLKTNMQFGLSEDEVKKRQLQYVALSRTKNNVNILQ